MHESEQEWTDLLTLLGDLSGWNEDKPFHKCEPWNFGDAGEIGYPMGLIAEATGTKVESLAALCNSSGYDWFLGRPCAELQAMWELPPEAEFPAVRLEYLPLVSMYAGLTIPHTAEKKDAREQLRCAALEVIKAWSRTPQGCRIIAPHTFLTDCNGGAF